MSREWNNDVADWGDFRLSEYFEWVKDTYGREEVMKGFIHLDEYRAIKDVQASVKTDEEIMGERYTDHLAHAMMHTKEVMAANIMGQLWEIKGE
jgi:hypothetical protein